MRLTRPGTNETVLTTDDYKQVLFSYETPVAAIINGEEYRTEQNWSRTTEKHISQFLRSKKTATVKPQAWFDSLLNVEVTK